MGGVRAASIGISAPVGVGGPPRHMRPFACITVRSFATTCTIGSSGAEGGGMTTDPVMGNISSPDGPSCSSAVFHADRGHTPTRVLALACMGVQIKIELSDQSPIIVHSSSPFAPILPTVLNHL